MLACHARAGNSGRLVVVVVVAAVRGSHSISNSSGGGSSGGAVVSVAASEGHITKQSSVSIGCTHTRLTALFPGLPRSAGTRKVKPIWIYWSKRQ